MPAVSLESSLDSGAWSLQKGCDMKLLATFNDEAQAWDLAITLRSKGILVHTSAGQVPFLMRTTLWAVLDEQYADALALLTNPQHVVNSGLSEAMLRQLQEQMDALAIPFWQRMVYSPYLLAAGLVLAMLFAMSGALDMRSGPVRDGTSYVHHFWEPSYAWYCEQCQQLSLDRVEPTRSTAWPDGSAGVGAQAWEPRN